MKKKLKYIPETECELYYFHKYKQYQKAVKQLKEKVNKLVNHIRTQEEQNRLRKLK